MLRLFPPDNLVNVVEALSLLLADTGRMVTMEDIMLSMTGPASSTSTRLDYQRRR